MNGDFVTNAGAHDSTKVNNLSDVNKSVINIFEKV